MNLKERIGEIVFNNVKRKNISCTNCGQEFLSEQYIAIDQATTDILKAVTKHLCDKVDGMKLEYPKHKHDWVDAGADIQHNKTLDEVKEMLRNNHFIVASKCRRPRIYNPKRKAY